MEFQTRVHTVDLRIALLGGFRVFVGSCDITTAFRLKRRPASLLKLLALTPGHALHRELVEDRLWPDLDGDSAANNLHQTLHQLRRLLEPCLADGRCSSFLVLEANVLRLRAPGALWIDVEAFEIAAQSAIGDAARVAHLEAAIALYGGDLLPEELFEDWIAPRRDALRGRYCDLLWELACMFQADSQPRAAIATLERLVRIEPTHEQAASELIELYQAAGQRQRALRQYRQLRSALSRELDCVTELPWVKLRDAVASPTPTRLMSHRLTDREREIGNLIARGLTNRHIAAILGMSPRTAETHVSHILRKLDLCSREQVADTLELHVDD
jgi:DNA-binding SARP family transcriptional activator